jgi:hypothetical protein
MNGWAVYIPCVPAWWRWRSSCLPLLDNRCLRNCRALLLQLSLVTPHRKSRRCLGGGYSVVSLQFERRYPPNKNHRNLQEPKIESVTIVVGNGSGAPSPLTSARTRELSWAERRWIERTNTTAIPIDHSAEFGDCQGVLA